MYYLQSRYYNPAVGRFVNADEAEIVLLLSKHTNFVSFFSSCCNSPIERSDPWGYASYYNIYQWGKGSTWYIITKVNILWTTLIYKYTIDDEVIRFNFKNNNYWSILWRGKAKMLAEAMYKAGKHINKNYLKGRTIGGLHTELVVHWALCTLGIKGGSTTEADMGARYGSIGPDSNAWVFEMVNIITRVAKINVNHLWGSISFLRDLIRYF